jgi:hemoglobin/transferrin/lactoferrin receptor protein
LKTGYKQYDILQKIMFNIGNVKNVLNIQYSTTSNINRYDRLTEINNEGIAKNAQWYYGPQKRLLTAWHLSLPKSDYYDQAEITTAYQDIEESRHNRGFNAAKLNHRTEKVNVLSMNSDFKKTLDKNEFTYGAELVYNKVNSSAYFDNITNGQFGPTDTRYPNGGSNTQSYAVYGTVLNKLSEKIIFTSGFRYSKNRLYSKFTDKTFFPFPFDDITQNSSALTGNIGFIILPKNQWKITVVLSTGFRTPNVDDMGKVFESGNGTLIIPNPNLKPEKTTNVELGITKVIVAKYRFAGSVWYTNYYNALTTDFSTINGSPEILYGGILSKVVTVVNKNKSYVWGISANTDAAITDKLSFSSTINYTYGRIIEGEANYPLDHIAPLFGKTNFTYRQGKFTGEVFALYNGAKDSSNYNLRGEDNHIYSADPVRGFTPGWFTLNLRTSFEIHPQATIQFAIENMANKFYRVFASGLSAPGRNFVLTFRSRL